MSLIAIWRLIARQLAKYRLIARFVTRSVINDARDYGGSNEERILTRTLSTSVA
jgi:hypothetical protein